MVKIGIIGGSGLDNPRFFKEFREREVETPFGKPSSPLKEGKLLEKEVVFLARHGRKHTLNPTRVPYQANIWALKHVGCTHILASSACGSLKEEIKPGDFVILDQFIDFTKQRKQTLYEDKVCHLPLAEPFCPKLRNILIDTLKELKFSYHPRGTVITIEGPRFSTRAESFLFRQWGVEVINMTTTPEAILAREAGICYSVIAMVTDYDCWKDTIVTWEEVLRVFQKNTEKIQQLFLTSIPKIKDERCECKEEVKKAILDFE